jgi:hypothetical protein
MGVISLLACSLLIPGALRAAPAGVSASPLASDRQALESFFSNGGPAIRFVFSPSLQGRDLPPSAAAAPVPPAAPALQFNGSAVGAYRFGGGAEPVLAAAIDAARDSVYLAAPVFASAQVSEAMVRAKRRGVDVRLLTAYSSVAPAGGAPRSPELRAVIFSGAQLRSLPAEGRLSPWPGAFAILDGRLVETGSLKPGEDPAAHHGIVFRDEPGTVLGFTSTWAWLWSQAKPLSGLAVASADSPPAEEAVGSLRFKGRSWPAWVMPVQGASEARLAAAIGLCRASVDIALPGLTAKLARALSEARGRGAAVRVLADEGMPAADLQALLETGADVVLHGGGALRAQFAVLDGELAQVGSFGAALGAAVFSTDADDLRGFSAEFSALRSSSR